MTTSNDDPPTLESLTNLLTSFIEEQRESNQKTTKQFNKVRSDLKTVQNDLGVVKGGHARTEVLRKASLIATDMGYRFHKNLRRTQIESIADRGGNRFDANQLMSFRNADLIMEVADQQNRPHYIAGGRSGRRGHD
jgi:hypothetical protein